jgi:streptogramin lyase
MTRSRMPARKGLIVTASVAILAVALTATFAISQADASGGGFALSKAAPESVCPEISPGSSECEALRVPTVVASSALAVGPELEGSGEKGGFAPADLRAAYKLPETGGSSQTVAVIDEYDDPKAEADLKVYREKYKLPACTEANGCFRKINSKGESKSYPPGEPGWAGETSLDLDMVSAACGECHLVLVEAGAASTEAEFLSAMLTAEEAAVNWEEVGTKRKVTEISNSWDVWEFSGETADDAFFNHPEIPITVASGDYGYAGRLRWPASSQYVISVGGTALKKAETARGWTEEPWRNTAKEVGIHGAGTTSGCSAYEPKPKWQKDKPCTNRTVSDVAAVATTLSAYDSYEEPGWGNYAGTSASAPFIAGVEALATAYSRGLGAEAFYLAGAEGALFDVTKGTNGGKCTPPAEDEYYCVAKVGYDAPTGWGTPDGVLMAGAPHATTKPATSLTKTTATLNGTINPQGVETKYYFEYGETLAYGATTGEASAGSGTANVEVSKAIAGLTAGGKYHFRVVATSSRGTKVGADEVFNTLPNAPVSTEPPIVSPVAPYQAVPESATTGGWTNSPTSYAYQWERCNASGGECAEIAGATSATYVPIVPDVGHTLEVKVTATNSGGSGIVHSAATGLVQALGEIAEYPITGASFPLGIAAGPDGNLWFTAENAWIGKITTSGSITKYSLPINSGPNSIAAGPDGNLWFTDYNFSKIGKITTSGTVTEYALPEGSHPWSIVAGPDGKLWFADSGTNKIGKITTAGAVTEYALPEKSEPKGIAAGPDGDVWFTDAAASKVGKITTGGSIAEYALASGSYPYAIAAGADGNLWFSASTTNKIGKITTTGAVTEYALPTGSIPRGITAGPDLEMWFTEKGTSKIGRISGAGVVSEFALPKGSEPNRITVGADGSLWFTDFGSTMIGRITP